MTGLLVGAAASRTGRPRTALLTSAPRATRLVRPNPRAFAKDGAGVVVIVVVLSVSLCVRVCERRSSRVCGTQIQENTPPLTIQNANAICGTLCGTRRSMAAPPRRATATTTAGNGGPWLRGHCWGTDRQHVPRCFALEHLAKLTRATDYIARALVHTTHPWVW